MAESLLNRRSDAIRRLTRKGATAALAKVVSHARAEDVAAAINHLGPSDQRAVFQQVADDTVAADVLTRIGPDELNRVVADLAPDRLARLIREMDADDQADILEHLSPELREAMLARLKGAEREEIEELMGYPRDSAGGIMSPVAFRLQRDATCRDAIAAVQEASDHELVYYAYIENEGGQLVGVTSLRNLLMHPPSTRLVEIMAMDVIAVEANTDQEDVARIADRYNLLAVPVVDDHRKLLGIVTVDDVIDVIREEAAEDMLLMAGVGDEADSRLGVVRRRLPWLAITLVLGIAISEIIGRFGNVLRADLALAGFIPMLTGMSGNVGIQSATVTVRNIALGRMDDGVAKLVSREVYAGFVMGLLFASSIAAYSMLRYGDWHIATSVGVAGLCNVTAAALMGAFVPLTLRRLGVDPAVATGPFVTTAMDAVGVTVYLSVAAGLASL